MGLLAAPVPMPTVPEATRLRAIGAMIPTLLIAFPARNGDAKEANQSKRNNHYEKTRTIRQHQCKEKGWHQPPEIQIHHRSQGLQEDEGQEGWVQRKMKPHPDDSIFKVKDFINELSRVQDAYFESLCFELGLDGEDQLRDHLFDYIYNETEMITFGEYLDKFGIGDLWDGL